MNKDIISYYAYKNYHMPPGEGAAFANGFDSRNTEVARLKATIAKLKQRLKMAIKPLDDRRG